MGMSWEAPSAAAIRRLVVDLRGRDVPVAEQFLDLADIDPGPQEQGRRCGPQRVRRVRAGAASLSRPGLAREDAPGSR